MNRFFWMTLAQKEIDYVEEYEGKFYAFEFRWNEKDQKLKRREHRVEDAENAENKAKD